ncbi:Symplekin tight junction protein C terminal-domain-containing protein [Dichotomocladium elegans]|nr:Symplekin tight junction protein C terminal-domain-containing protein [Dichotomocladium elegans]
MDLSGALTQLSEFTQETLATPNNAQSYATNQFLSSLVDLINEYITKFDDFKVVKDAFRAFALVLPYVFNTVCQNEAETRMWNTALELAQLITNALTTHREAGIRISALKGIQTLILLESKSDRTSQRDPSLSLVRPQHRLLNVQQLEENGQELLSVMLALLVKPDEKSTIVSATLNCLVPIVRKRPQFYRQIMDGMLNATRSPPAEMSAVQKRSVIKIVKIALTTLIRSDQLPQYRQEMIDEFASLGGNPAMFQSRQRERERAEEARRSKRSLPPSAADTVPEKRTKVAHGNAPIRNQPAPQNPMDALRNFDVTNIPLAIVIELCITALQQVSEQEIRQRFDMLPPEGILGLSSASLPSSSSTQPQPTGNPNISQIQVPSHPQPFSTQQQQQQPARSHPVANIKNEEDTDVKLTTSTRSRVPLASVQERATQSFKMKPYELTAPTSIAHSEQLDLLKMSIQRIFDAEYQLQMKTFEENDGRNEVGGAQRRPVTSWSQSTRTTWLLLIAKLVARGVNNKYPGRPAEENGSDTRGMDMDAKYETMENANTDDIKHMLVDFIVADLPSRYEIALGWLMEEFLCDTELARRDRSYQPQCFKWLLMVLNKGISTLEPKDKTLTKLLLDAPVIHQEAVEIVRKHMKEEPSRFVSCVSTLRELVTNRPPVRDACLNVLLDYCINPDIKMRSTSIVAVKKWVPDHPDIASKVEAYAIQALNMLTKNPPKKDKAGKEESEQKQEPMEIEPAEERKDGEGAESADDSDSNGWTEQDVVRHAELFFALCVKKNDLLDELFSVYIQTTDQVQRFIRQHIYQLIKSIGMHSPKLLETLRTFPPGAETLVIRILVALCDTVRPTPELVSAVKQVYQERNLDAKFLIPLVSGLSKEDLRQSLPRIVELLNNTDSQRKVVKKVFSRIVSSSATVAAPMNPTELLLALHEMGEGVPLPKAVEAISICFTMPDTFEVKFISNALRHLVDQPKIPILLMVTMIRTVSVYKSMVQFVIHLLEKLIKKKVWTYPKLWDGFVKCTDRTLPDSVKMVASLPKPQLKDILERIPSIQAPLREYAEQNQQVQVLVLMNDMGLIEKEQ